jgi:tetratricopeptide (TPR) repeat protein
LNIVVGLLLVFGAIILLPFMKIIAFFIARYLSEKISNKVIGGLYYPKNKSIPPPPPEFSDIKAVLIRGETEKALELLLDIYDENKKNFYYIDLLSDIYLDKLNDYESTVEILTEYFNSSEKRISKDITLLMKLVEAYQESGNTEKAVEILKKEEKNKHYTENAAEAIRKKITGLSGL